VLSPGLRLFRLGRVWALVCVLAGGLLCAGRFPDPEEPGFKALLEKAWSRFESLRTYECLLESYSSNGRDAETSLYQYYFKKPGFIRARMLEGRNPGTILIYDPHKNRVRVKVGRGLLSLLRLSLSPSNPKIVDLRGYGLDHSDWGWFIRQHLARLDLFDSRRVGEEPVGGRLSWIYELVSKDPGKTESLAREKIWVDARDDIITRYQLFDTEGRLAEAATFTSIVLDPDLAPGLFRDF
jgi:outer membrane lipoprotein-sorting protein